mgnify:CR=1 FL=1
MAAPSTIALMKAYIMKTIQRATRILQTIRKNDSEGIRLSELSQNTDLHITTTRRILHALQKEHFVFYDKMNKTYHLGVELYFLGKTSHHSTLKIKFRPVLEEIVAQTGDGIVLMTRNDLDAICLDRVDGVYPVRAMQIESGSIRPLAIGPSSLALIAFGKQSEFDSIINTNKERILKFNKFLTIEKLYKTAKQAQIDGFVYFEGMFVNGQFFDDVIGISVPVFLKNKQVIASVLVSSVKSRMGKNRVIEIVNIIKKTFKEKLDW